MLDPEQKEIKQKEQCIAVSDQLTEHVVLEQHDLNVRGMKIQLSP